MSEGNPLISLLDECVVRIKRDGEFAGSGFFVAPGEVLTCAHVLGTGEAIAVGQRGWESEATLIAAAPPLAQASEPGGFPFPDLALLRLGDAPADHRCAGLSEETPVAGVNADLLRLSAYSRDVHRPGVEANGATVWFEGRFGDHGVLKLREGQVVHGFSGSPVLNMRTGRVCGVVDSTRDEKSDLGGFAIPVSLAGEEFEGLIERNEATLANGIWEGAVEGEKVAAAARQGEAERLPIVPPPYRLEPGADYAPSELLKPRYGAVELLGREGLQAHLMRWREAAGGLGIVMLTGGGGSGKTRLALEECTRAEQAGWMAGMLALDGEAEAGAELERLFEWPGRLFVAVDYAETRPAVVRTLIRRLSRRAGRPPARLLLICRQAGTKQEFEGLFAAGDDRDSIAVALRSGEPVRLSDPRNLLDSHLLFEAGVAGFAARLGKDEPPSSKRVSLGQEHFARPLFVLAAALLHVEDPTIEIDALGKDELMLELIDRHETQYWERWDKSLGTGLDKSLHGRSVALATMLGAEDEAEALALAAAIPGLEDADGERRLQVARWLSHLYASGRLDRAPAISPVEPDVLGEALVARELGRRPGLIDAALDLASDAQLTRLLNFLVRAAGDGSELEAQVKGSLDERLPALVQRASSTGDGELAAALDLVVRELRPVRGAIEAVGEAADSPALEKLELSLLRLSIAAALAAPENTTSATMLASLRTALSASLRELGHYEEAGEVARQAVGGCRELVKADPDPFLPALAASLQALAAALGILRDEEAAPVAEEAVALQEWLDDEGGLAMALNTLSPSLSDLGRHEEAIAASREAVKRQRKLAKDGSPSERGHLAGYLNNLAVALGGSEDAAEALEESVTLYSVLIEEEGDRHLPRLTASLQSLAGILVDLEREDEALALAEQAVEHRRELARAERWRYLEALAASLSTLSSVLGRLGKDEAALATLEEAVGYRRELAEKDPGKHLAPLTASLGMLWLALLEEERFEEVVDVLGEIVTNWREPAAQDPATYGVVFTEALLDLSTALARLGDRLGARATIEEAVEWLRAHAKGDPELYEPRLATALSSISTRLLEFDEHELAVKASEEAVALIGELAQKDREEHLPELARALNNLSHALTSIGREEAALGALEEAVAVQRELVEEDPKAHLRRLMPLLNNLGAALAGAKRGEESLVVAEESLAGYRDLARENPRRYLPELADVLRNTSRRLDDAGREEEAHGLIEAVLREHGEETAPLALRMGMAEWQARSGDLRTAVLLAHDILLRSFDAERDSLAAETRMLLRSLRVKDETAFDATWEELGDLPPWLREPTPSDRLIDLHAEWLGAATPEDSRRFLETHAEEMLTDAGESALGYLVDLEPGRDARRRNLALLLISREESISAAYRVIDDLKASSLRRETLQEWLAISWEDSLQFFLEHRDELLDPAAEHDLLEEASVELDDSSLLVRIALLGLARIRGPEAAHELLNREPPGLKDTACLRSREDPEALALARLRSGLDGENPEAQFQHAIAAITAGPAWEALRAIKRCRDLVPSWEVSSYQRRLEELTKVDPALAKGPLALSELLDDRGPPAGDD